MEHVYLKSNKLIESIEFYEILPKLLL